MRPTLQAARRCGRPSDCAARRKTSEADITNEQAVLEPDVGQTRLWDTLVVKASHDNARRNGVAGALALYAPEQAPDQRCEVKVVVANILANALDTLAPRIAALTAPGGQLALSGILAGQEAPLLARYAQWFDGLAATGREDWIRIDGVRRAD